MKYQRCKTWLRRCTCMENRARKVVSFPDSVRVYRRLEPWPCLTCRVRNNKSRRNPCSHTVKESVLMGHPSIQWIKDTAPKVWKKWRKSTQKYHQKQSTFRKCNSHLSSWLSRETLVWKLSSTFTGSWTRRRTTGLLLRGGSLDKWLLNRNRLKMPSKDMFWKSWWKKTSLLSGNG